MAALVEGVTGCTLFRGTLTPRDIGIGEKLLDRLLRFLLLWLGFASLLLLRYGNLVARLCRLYRRKDVELLLRIKHLLRDKRFTIEGARQSLHAEAKAPKMARTVKLAQRELFSDDPLPEIRRELADILQLLK